MKTIKGPAIFLAQFLGDKRPYNSLDNICKWVARQGYKAVQIPSWDARCIDLEKAAKSKTYCDEIQGIVHSHGLKISELSTHLQGQLVAVNPCYDMMFDAFAPKECKNNPKKRQRWATQQVKWAAQASKNLRLKSCATFSGALIWQTMYPWPQRPAGLVDTAFSELAKRWKPILNHYDKYGIDLCYEIHPGEDIHDGATWEMFLDAVSGHKRANILYDPSHFLLQQLDYIHFIDLYNDRIKMFHVKDAEFNPNGRVGVYGGYQKWSDRAGRFRSLGDGQIDFVTIFSKLAQYGYNGWAVMEWECCIKSPEQGAREGAPFIEDHIIKVTKKSFDDFAGAKINKQQVKKILGI